MKFTLFFIVFIMYILTKRYNEYDFFKNSFLDLSIQLLHIVTLGYIFYYLVNINLPIIAFFCAYVLFKNIDCFIDNITDNYEYAADDNDESENKLTEDNNSENEQER